MCRGDGHSVGRVLTERRSDTCVSSISRECVNQHRQAQPPPTPPSTPFPHSLNRNVCALEFPAIARRAGRNNSALPCRRGMIYGNVDVSPLTSTFSRELCQGCEVAGEANLSGEYFFYPALWKGNKYLGDREPSRRYKAYLRLSWIISRQLKMMYDFHYPSGRGKLNEDTANCRAERCGVMGKRWGRRKREIRREKHCRFRPPPLCSVS